MLRKMNYEVLVADDGTTGLDLWKQAMAVI